MLKINRGSKNIVITTFNEKSTLYASGQSVWYLWRVKREQGLEEKYFIVQVDDSEFPDRFNKFTIAEDPNAEDPVTGKITLKSGRWYYWVYEQSDNLNLDIANTVGLVEEGLIHVFDTPIQEYIEPSYTEQIYTQ